MNLPLATRILPNGLTVFVREDRKAPVVTVNFWVRVGSNHEDDAVLGWSHGIEHMMFKGTPRRGPGVAAREVRDAGGALNAGTGYETTHYYVTVPTRSLRAAFDVQADAIRNSSFDAAELDRERLVILEENRMYRDRPDGFGHTWEKLLALAFESSNYRRPIGGPDESLRATPREAILAYRDLHYVPGNAALAIAGDVGAEEAFELAEAAYGGWPARPVPEVAFPVEPRQRETRFHAVPGPLAKCYVKIGWRAGPETDRDSYAMLVLLRLLARGRSSWIYRELLDARGLLSGLSVLQETGSRESVFVLDVVTDAATLDPLLRGVAEGAARFQDALVSEADLERVKNFMTRSHVLGQETTGAQAHALGHGFARGDATLADRFPEIVESITRDDVRRVAEERLDPSQWSVLVHHPEVDGPVAAPVSLGPGVPRARAAAATAPAATAPRAPSPAAAAARAESPRLVVRLPPPGFRRIALDGGATLLFNPRRALPAGAFSAFVRCGTVHESAETNGVNALTLRSMVKSTATRTSEQIANESEALGATITPTCGLDASGLHFATVARFLDPAFEAFGDVLCHPNFPGRVVEGERVRLLADIAQEEDEPFETTSRELHRALFGADPYGLPVLGAEGSVRTLGVEALASWHARFYRPDSLLFVAVGDFEEAALLGRAGAMLDALGTRASGATRPAAAPPAPLDISPAAREVLLERDVHQAVVMIGYPGPNALHDDAIPLRVLAAAISGMGNRLFVALRDREGLCYSTGLWYHALVRAGTIGAFVGTAPATARRALAALEGEIDGLLDGGVSPDELHRAQNALIGQAAIGRQTNAAQASLAAGYELLGLGFEELDRFEGRVLAVTAPDVLRAARRWLRSDRRVLAVTRPKL